MIHYCALSDKSISELARGNACVPVAATIRFLTDS
jgi:hypothetical protein